MRIEITFWYHDSSIGVSPVNNTHQATLPPDRQSGQLNLETRLVKGKQLRRVTGVFAESGMPMSGYEIHKGVTTGSTLERPLVSLDGAVSQDSAVAGCYIHGLFEKAEACDTLLSWTGLTNQRAETDYQQHWAAELARLADAAQAHLTTRPIF